MVLSCLQIYVRQVCEDVFADPLNSAVQLAALRLLTNMTVTNDYQHLLSNYITGLLHLLLIGNGSTKVGCTALGLESCCVRLTEIEFPVLARRRAPLIPTLQRQAGFCELEVCLV